MANTNQHVMWRDNGNHRSFNGFIQLFTDKTVTTLKSNGMVAHAVHATLINFSKTYRRKLIHEGKTIIGFLPCTDDKPTESQSTTILDDVTMNEMDLNNH